jgi:crotonobetaine/carnitine-CoA ligase
VGALGSSEDATYVGALGEPTTIPAVLRARAEQSPDGRFVHFDGVQRTYAEALLAAERAAAGLAALGVGRGDRVALMLPNCLEFLDLWFGLALLGAVLVPINPALKGDGLRYLLEHSEAAAAIVDDPLTDTVDEAVGHAGPRHRIVARGPARDRWRDSAEVLKGDRASLATPTVQPGDLASILYTSGTTGPPKGVRNCHNAYPTAGYEFTQHYARLCTDDVLYTSLPLFHVNAQMLTTVGSIVSGVPMVLAPRFSASGFFDDLRRHGATVFNYIGAMLTMLYKQTERPDDRENPVRVTIGGAAPAELWKAFEARFGVEILEIYGLTETATFTLGSPPDDIRVGKVGLPVSWAEVQVHREDGTVAEPGEPGEIVVRSKRPDVLFQGYDKNEEATERAMAGGWFHSGDRGRRDEDGYFVFLDRLKDSIRRRGENISSYEVERVVNSHRAVAESAAVGVPSELGEEEVMIVLVPRDGLEVDPSELVAYCSERMASFMVPRFVRIRAELPKTATQRVQKFALREEGARGAWDRMSETPVK